MALIKEYLESQGFEVDIFYYSNGKSTYNDLETYAKNVSERLEKEKYSAVIAHSMGGPIIRFAVQNKPLVQKIIFLESPIGLPRWIIFLARLMGIPLKLKYRSVKCLMTGSEFLQNIKLNKNISYYQIGGIYSLCLRKTFVDRLIPIKIFPVTHSQLLTNKPVLQKISNILKS
jgi:hypothetical protein